MRYSQVVAVAALALGMSALGAAGAQAADTVEIPNPGVTITWTHETCTTDAATWHQWANFIPTVPAPDGHYTLEAKPFVWSGKNVVQWGVSAAADNGYMFAGGASTYAPSEWFRDATACPPPISPPQEPFVEPSAPAPDETQAPASKTTEQTTTTTKATTQQVAPQTTTVVTEPTTETTEPTADPDTIDSTETPAAESAQSVEVTPSPTLEPVAADAPTDPMLPIGIVATLLFAAVGGGYAAHRYLPKR